MHHVPPSQAMARTRNLENGESTGIPNAPGRSVRRRVHCRCPSINLKSCPQKEVYENEVKRSVSHGGKQETYHLSDLKHDPRELRVCRTQASILSWLLGGLGLIVVPSISAT
jgi:hypothetical protein